MLCTQLDRHAPGQYQKHYLWLEAECYSLYNTVWNRRCPLRIFKSFYYIYADFFNV